MRKQVLVATGLGLSLLLCGTAPPAPRDPQVAQGVRQFEDGDLSAALETLGTAARRLSSDPAARTDLALARLYSGLACSGLGQDQAARAGFRGASTLQPGPTLDASRFARCAQARIGARPAPRASTP